MIKEWLSVRNTVNLEHEEDTNTLRDNIFNNLIEKNLLEMKMNRPKRANYKKLALFFLEQIK